MKPFENEKRNLGSVESQNIAPRSSKTRKLIIAGVAIVLLVVFGVSFLVFGQEASKTSVPAVSPVPVIDRILFTGDNLHKLSAVNSDGSDLKVYLDRTNFGSNIFNPVLSRDGSLVAFGSGSGVHVLDTSNSSIKIVVPGVYSYTFSPDSKSLIYQDADQQIVSIDLNSGAKKNLTKDYKEYAYDLHCTPDGKWIYFSKLISDPHTISDLCRLDATGNGAITDIFNFSYCTIDMKLSPDGKKLVYFTVGDNSRKLCIYDIESNSEVPLYDKDLLSRIRSWSGNSKKIYVTAKDKNHPDNNDKFLFQFNITNKKLEPIKAGGKLIPAD